MSNDEMGRMLAAKMACQLEISKIDLTADGLRAMIPIMQETGVIDKKCSGLASSKRRWLGPAGAWTLP